MTWLILLAVLAAAVFVFASTAAKNKTKDGGLAESGSDAAGDGFPYALGANLFSPAERSFLGVLEQAVGEEYRVYGKVRIADVIDVRATRDRSLWKRAFNRISAKHFDFVLCSPTTRAVVCAVELDDKSHRESLRVTRDEFVVGVCKAAALPLIQVAAQHSYAIEEIRRLLRETLPGSALPLGQMAVPSAEPPPANRRQP